MNERIRELWSECVVKHTKDPMNWQSVADEFAELIVKECIDNLEFHGHDEAVSQLKWLKVNRFGVE